MFDLAYCRDIGEHIGDGWNILVGDPLVGFLGRASPKTGTR